MKVVPLMTLMVLLVGCANTAPPRNQSNACDIFKSKDGWYDATADATKKWGISEGTILAFMRQESSFVHNARPPRKKILWVIPGPRASNAFGYAQAKTGTWAEYKKEANWGADRDNFRDAADFIGWYNARSARSVGISRRNAKHLYYAYHEGMGGYKRGTYKKKRWLQNVASSVASRAQTYDRQLAGCRDSLKRSFWPF
ncbi:transglycosylase SLT domain-containing protein [Litorivicinus lipolyticus]|nr:hypothetical protein [Litorivicinus lipolyticus]